MNRIPKTNYYHPRSNINDRISVECEGIENFLLWIKNRFFFILFMIFTSIDYEAHEIGKNNVC